MTANSHQNKQIHLDIVPRSFATFETFVCSEENELLDVLINLKETTQEPRQYFLWGANNSGKSHLLHAVCNHLAMSPSNAIYLPLSQFTSNDFNILRDIHHLDVICLDDVDKVFCDLNWEHALFQLINELRADNKTIVMTASINPNSAKISLPDLASRLVWGPVYKLTTLSDEQKTEVLKLQAKARGFDISLDVSNYLINRYSRDITNLVSLLNEIDQQSLAQKRKVTIPFIKTVLESI